MQYFVIFTVQHGAAQYSGSCTVDVKSGATRQQIFVDVRATAPAPFNTSGAVTFFYCEPNRLGGA